MIDNVITKIEKLKPSQTEAIVLRFKLGDIDFDTFINIFNKVESKFPENIVLAIPDCIELQSCDKKMLKDIVNMILENIDKMPE